MGDSGQTPGPRKSFGAYLVDRELGRGGMGVVYEAVHEVLGRRAAVKVLLSDVSRDAELVERFKNEARAASAIEHPSIVKVYDVGHDDDAVYIVMELLPGESLASRLKRGAMSIPTAINFARQCAKALEAAHDANIVHRDLKPDNVFLVPDAEVPGGERVKLLDFGVAKLVEPGTASVARTVTGAILGTPHYMSPEQCEGAREVDPRSDLYSLGCMLFQMVTGRLPFQSAGVGGLIGMHLHVAPPTVASLRPDAPDQLDALVARLLAKSPDDRPQSAAEVAQALVEINPGVRASARGMVTAQQVPKAPVDPASATVVSVFAPTIAEVTGVTGNVTAKVTERVAARRRRWLWPAIGGLVVAGVVAIVIASRHDPAADPVRVTRDDRVHAPVDAAAPVAIDGAVAIDAVVAQLPIDADVKPVPAPHPPKKSQPPPATVEDKQAARMAKLVDDWVERMNTPNNWVLVASACNSMVGSEAAIKRINWERCVIAACKSYDGSLIIARAPQDKQLELRDLCDETRRKVEPQKKAD